MTGTVELSTIHDLDGLVALVRAHGDDNLYVRWSAGPDTDLVAGSGGHSASHDGLTGVPLPGLSANPLRTEPWWGDRSPRLWLARRLFDYRHLAELRGPGVRAWVLTGEEVGRGPDNEPLVRCRRPVAWIEDGALAECERMIANQNSAEWGPLDRR
ncbi:MAG TPA: DUF6098 family protein [Pseudonocardiaceae bacterium]|jgi:hypothetical protein|nr:DUF6098 family protein [Pseudonocardiaceae bacterium]